MAAWRQQQAADAALLEERDRLGCQQAGPSGPPFGPRAGGLGRLLARWTGWFSLDGTGWCYEAEADELLRCEDAGPVDWNGVTLRRGGSVSAADVLAALIVCLGLAAAVAAGGAMAFSQWQSRARRGDKADAAAAPPGLRAWLRTPEAWRPWRWGSSPLSIAACGLAGVILALMLPVPNDTYAWL
jgi:hypothetical protein